MAATALLCDGSDVLLKASRFRRHRVVGIAEYGREHEGTHAGERGTGGVGVGSSSLLLEPFFEKLVSGVVEEQLVKEQFEVSMARRGAVIV